MEEKDILNYQKKYATSSAQEVLTWAIDYFGGEKIAFASSLGVEDQVLTHMIMNLVSKCRIFTLDTRRLPQETYDLAEDTMQQYNFRYDFLFPDAAAVSEMERLDGPNLFYHSVENRKKCCYTRKVEPLKRKLLTLDAWICGLRRDQAITRSNIEKVEWDNTFSLVKINPIADWTESRVWDYIRKHKIVFNALHSKGYPSIGCAPCTRAVKKGEDIRGGRWWWELPEHKECGLHLKDKTKNIKEK